VKAVAKVAVAANAANAVASAAAVAVMSAPQAISHAPSTRRWIKSPQEQRPVQTMLRWRSASRVLRVKAEANAVVKAVASAVNVANVAVKAVASVAANAVVMVSVARAATRRSMPQPKQTSKAAWAQAWQQALP
jgi:hypothetical protein